MTYNYIIVCHSGAGSHSLSKENMYKAVCKKACKAAQLILKETNISEPNLIKAAVEAVKVLENDSCTNAGYGSNLTYNGKVQCDASIMCGQSLRFGAVGCLSNIKNPIVVAEKILNLQLENTLLSDGRYPPSILVGKDATEWAISNNIEYVNDDELITLDRRKKFEKFRKPSERGISLKRKLVDDVKKPKLSVNDDENKLLDTVGVIIADTFGRVVSASSSGGILLKHDGRLGQSCIYGSGCFSEQKDNGISVTAVSTGLGEQLMRTMLPMKTCEFLSTSFCNDDENIHQQFQSFLDRNFMNSGFISGDLTKSFGILCLRSEKITESKVTIDLLFGHSTPSMCFGYLNSQEKDPQLVMSRKPDSNTEFIIGSMGTIFQR